jgi:hypothetical protein
MHASSNPISIPVEELKTLAAAVAEEMKSAGEVSPDLRRRFIEVRAALFQRGIYDPVLVRFDSATAPAAGIPEIAGQLAAIAASLP